MIFDLKLKTMQSYFELHRFFLFFLPRISQIKNEIVHYI